MCERLLLTAGNVPVVTEVPPDPFDTDVVLLKTVGPKNNNLPRIKIRNHH